MFRVRQTQHTDVHVIVISSHHHWSPRVTVVAIHDHSVIFYVSHPGGSCTCRSRCHLMFYIFYVLPINNFCLLVLSIYVSPSTRYRGQLSTVVMQWCWLFVKVRRGRRACVYVRCCPHVLMMHHALSSACRAGVPVRCADRPLTSLVFV